MDLSIIIVNWNTKDLLKKCLESIYQETRDLSFEVFVVDNGSRDGSVEFLKAVEETFRSPDGSLKTSSTEIQNIKVILNRQNLGFAQANNQAIEKSKGKYILLLNPDTVILGDTLKKMIDFLENHSKVGILGPKILNPDGSLQPSCRTFPTLGSQVLILLKLHNFFTGLAVIKKYYMLDWDYSRIREVDQVMGSCFMIRKKLIDKIGLLDEDYWIWFEEVDFCKRAKLAGWKTCFLPDVSIIHHKAKAFQQVSPIKKQLRLNRSLLRYFKKFHSKSAYFILWSFCPKSILLAGVVQLVSKFRPIKKKKEL